MSEDLQALIASAVPGRLRLRGRRLRHAGTLARLRQHLHACPGLHSLEVNPRVGSLLLHYDPAQLPPAQAQARVSAALQAALQAGADTPPTASAATPIATALTPARQPRRPRTPRSQPARSAAASARLRVPVAEPPPPERTPARAADKPPRPKLKHTLNRGAKLGMLLSLSASMALAASGAKRAHIVSGACFLMLLCVHLSLHRKRLLK